MAVAPDDVLWGIQEELLAQIVEMVDLARQGSYVSFPKRSHKAKPVHVKRPSDKHRGPRKMTPAEAFRYMGQNGGPVRYVPKGG